MSWKHDFVGRHSKHKFMYLNRLGQAYVSGFCNTLLGRKNYTKPPTNIWKFLKQGSQNLKFHNHIFLLAAPDLRQWVDSINIFPKFILRPYFSQKFPLLGLISHSYLTRFIYYFHFQTQKKNWDNLTAVKCNDVARFTVIRRGVAQCYNKVGHLGCMETMVTP